MYREILTNQEVDEQEKAERAEDKQEPGLNPHPYEGLSGFTADSKLKDNGDKFPVSMLDKKYVTEEIPSEDCFEDRKHLNRDEMKVGRITLGPHQVSYDGLLPDSGKRREFDTGSVRDDRTGKGRYDLLSPIAMKRDAVLMEKGAIKYADRNWEKGQPIMSYLDSAKRHLECYTLDLLMGRKHEEDHLAAVRWNIAAMMHMEHMIKHGLLPKELDDRPKPQPKLVGKTYTSIDVPEEGHDVGC